MKIFISWSGEKSRIAALAIHEWLPSVVQNADPFVSEEDIEKGTVGLDIIAEHLRDSQYGIICLTKENLNGQWINFEGGALSKELDCRIWTFLLDLDVTDVTGPLRKFQHTRPNDKDVFKLIKDIHKVASTKISVGELKETFDQKWPKLAKVLATIPQTAQTQPVTIQSLITQVVRVQRVTASPSPIKPGAILTLVYNIQSSQDVNGLWLGSSYLGEGQLWNSAPDDIPIKLVNGVHDYVRRFKISEKTPIGSQKLRVNVWFGSPGDTNHSTNIYASSLTFVIAK